MNTRRDFIRITAMASVIAGLPKLQASPLSPEPRKDPKWLFHLGIAGYTFREFDIDGTIGILKKTGITNLSLKDFHLPMNSSQEQINTILQRFKDAGVLVYTLGVIYMKTPESVDLAFKYAQMAGVDMIVGAPDYNLLPFVEEKVKNYNIRLAIHNHGPDNPLYPNASDIWAHIERLDPRIGICLDIGHTVRDGKDPAEDILRYANRIFDVHIKDVDRASVEGKTIEMGRGIINIPAVVKSLGKVSYSGMCSLEFEKDMKDPLAGIAESLGYFRGVMDALK